MYVDGTVHGVLIKGGPHFRGTCTLTEGFHSTRSVDFLIND